MSDAITLAPHDVHVWLAFYDRITDERVHCAYRQIISAAERDQELRFCLARDRLRYLVTRVLTRTVLSRYAAVAPADWQFSTNSYGRPEIVNPEARCAELSFNISHTHGLIVVGVSRCCTLGVDAESLCADGVSTGIAERFFAPEEVAALAATPQREQEHRFFEYWTIKEAYIKARGRGLSLPLDKICVHYPDERAVAISIHPDLADDPARWQFWQFRPTRQHLVALCAERLDSRDSSLVVRVVNPGISETTVDPTFVRASHRTTVL